MATLKKTEKPVKSVKKTNSNGDKRVGKLVRAAAVAVALGVETAPAMAAPQTPTPIVTRKAAASTTPAQSTRSVSRKANAPHSMAAMLLGLQSPPETVASADKTDGNHFPLVVQPVLPKAEIDTLDQVRVAVFDENGQRVLHALVHGRCKLGPLPAGKYTVEIATRGHDGAHKVKLGPGSAGVVKYELASA